MDEYIMYTVKDICLIWPGYMTIQLEWSEAALGEDDLPFKISNDNITLTLPFETFIQGAEDVYDGYMLRPSVHRYHGGLVYLYSTDGGFKNQLKFDWKAQYDRSLFLVEGKMWDEKSHSPMKVGSIYSSLDIMPYMQFPKKLRKLRVKEALRFKEGDTQYAIMQILTPAEDLIKISLMDRFQYARNG